MEQQLIDLSETYFAFRSTNILNVIDLNEMYFAFCSTNIRNVIDLNEMYFAFCSTNIRNVLCICFKQIQSTLVISNSKGLYETLRDIRTSTYQICGTEENNLSNNHLLQNEYVI